MPQLYHSRTLGSAGQVSVTGLAELSKRLSEMPAKIAKGAYRKAMRKGSKLIQDAMRSKAPKGSEKKPVAKRGKYAGKGWTERHPGKLKQNILTKVWIKNDAAGGLVGATIGLRKKPEGKDVFYGRFVERGTSKRGPQPFARPAYDENKEKAVQCFADAVRDQIAGADGGV